YCGDWRKVGFRECPMVFLRFNWVSEASEMKCYCHCEKRSNDANLVLRAFTRPRSASLRSQGRPTISSNGGEHRHRRAAVARLEDKLYRQPDTDLVEVAVDDVGLDRLAFAQRHIGYGIGYRRAAHHAVGVDGAVAGGLRQLGL